MILFIIAVLAVLFQYVTSQQIWDKFETTWDRSKLFTYTNIRPPLTFGAKGDAQQANILVQDTNIHQTMLGFGASLTESSAQLFSHLKNKNNASYWSLINHLFDPTDGHTAAGLSYIRVPLGSSDFSATRYTLDVVTGDAALSDFDIDKSPPYLFSTLNDILSVNPGAKIHLVPWSPPAWMKDSSSINKGTFLTQYTNTYANYFLKAVQGYESKGIPVYAITLQNEPEFSTGSYPSCLLPVNAAAQLGTTLRTVLDKNGISSVKIIGYDHNWDHASQYPVQLMRKAGNAFSGVSFHCYGGQVNQQNDFREAFPDKEIYFTECSGIFGSDWWEDIKWQMDNIFIGSIEHGSVTGAMWNYALDGTGEPKLPGAGSCEPTGCRGVVTINTNGSWSPNQEFYGLAQASKAILPRDSGGPTGKRLGVTVSGAFDWALRVSAFVTGRASSGGQSKYSLVVMNWHDDDDGTWDPQPVTASIEFRGQQVTYTFPVGVTTLWWYAGVSNSTLTNTTVTEGSEVPQVVPEKHLDLPVQGVKPIQV